MDIEMIARNLSMTYEQAKDVVELFNKLVKENNKLAKGVHFETANDYVGWWEDNWFRSHSYEELLKSEVDQGGLEGDVATWRKQAEEFCETEMDNTIFKLPCGMYTQYV